jgi:hypothetical protein
VLGGGPAGFTASINLPLVVVNDVDLKYKTISVTVQGQSGASSGSSTSSTIGNSSSSSSAVSSLDRPTKLVDLPVYKRAEIIVDNKAVPLGALKPGMKLSMQIALDGGQLIVVAAGSMTVVRDDLMQLRGAAERAVREAAESRVVVLEAQAKVEVANKALTQANGMVEEQRAKAAVELARTQLELAQARSDVSQLQADQALRSLKAAEAEAEANRKK